MAARGGLVNATFFRRLISPERAALSTGAWYCHHGGFLPAGGVLATTHLTGGWAVPKYDGESGLTELFFHAAYRRDAVDPPPVLAHRDLAGANPALI